MRPREAATTAGECSVSSEGRRWHDTGIELSLGADKPSTSGQEESVPSIALDFDEARRQYKNTYGKPGSRYEDLFGEPPAAVNEKQCQGITQPGLVNIDTTFNLPKYFGVCLRESADRYLVSKQGTW